MSIPLPTMGKVSPKNNTNSKSHTTGRRLWNWDWYKEQEVEIGWKLIQVGWTFKRSWQILLILQPKYTRGTYKKTTQSHKTKTASHKQGWWLGVEGRPAVSSESGCWLRAAGSGAVHCSTLRALCDTSQCALLTCCAILHSARSLDDPCAQAHVLPEATDVGQGKDILPKKENFSQHIPIIRLAPKLMRPGLKMFLMLKKRSNDRSVQRPGAGCCGQ